MRRLLRLTPLLVPLIAAGALLAPRPAAGEAGGDGYVGAEACRRCHPVAYEAWVGSTHARTFVPAAPDTVPEDVAEGRTVQHDPGETTFHVTRGADGVRYEAETVGPSGNPERFPLTHVVGRARIRMLIATMPDGRHQVLPSMKEVGGPWFDYAYLIFGTGDPETAPVITPQDGSFWTGPERWFDARCSRCHVSGRAVAAPAGGAGRAAATWRTLGVDCESCHGPGRDHVAHQDGGGGMDPILPLGSLATDRAVSLCLRCHMEGEVFAPDLPPALDVFEHVAPTLLDETERVDPAGRQLELVYDGLPFLASRCAREGGMTCLTCHDPHGSAHPAALALPPTDPGLCVTCHEAIVANASAHAHHPADGPGGRCVDCHMPYLTIERGHGAVSDHTIGVPRPAAGGERVAIDACTWCHDGLRAAPPGAPSLAPEVLRRHHATWWPDAAPAPTWERTIAAARAGAPDVGPALLALAQDGDAPRVFRATAVRMLHGVGEPARAALLGLAGDRDPLVRGEAVGALAALRGADVDGALLAAMADPVVVVRVRAARAALEGWERLGEDAPLREGALRILAADAAAVPDDDLRWFRLGAARDVAGDARGAIEAYGRQVELDPWATRVHERIEQLRAGLEADGR